VGGSILWLNSKSERLEDRINWKTERLERTIDWKSKHLENTFDWKNTHLEDRLNWKTKHLEQSVGRVDQQLNQHRLKGSTERPALAVPVDHKLWQESKSQMDLLKRGLQSQSEQLAKLIEQRDAQEQ
jgi:predicted ATPase